MISQRKHPDLSVQQLHSVTIISSFTSPLKIYFAKISALRSSRLFPSITSVKMQAFEELLSVSDHFQDTLLSETCVVFCADFKNICNHMFKKFSPVGQVWSKMFSRRKSDEKWHRFLFDFLFCSWKIKTQFFSKSSAIDTRTGWLIYWSYSHKIFRLMNCAHCSRCWC